MKREWKPGDVAVRTNLDGTEVRTMVAVNPMGHAGGCLCTPHAERGRPHWHHVNGRWNPIEDGDDHGSYRPLVVIDPEDREAAERLISAVHDQYPTMRDLPPTDRNVDAMQAALREFANPTPPKPDEPTGLGAVVKDERNSLWFRMAVENQTWPGEVWQEQYGTADRWSKWDDVAAVTVLSEGVQP